MRQFSIREKKKYQFSKIKSKSRQLISVRVDFAKIIYGEVGLI